MSARPSRLAILRAERDLTQAQLAALAGLDTTTVASLENGQTRRPHARTLARIAKALGLELRELLEDNEEVAS